MDLRKSVLKKQALGDSSLLNSSSLSAYNSAMDDSDNSIYFSFIDESSKSIESDESVHSINSETEDKENTIIMRERFSSPIDILMTSSSKVNVSVETMGDDNTRKIEMHDQVMAEANQVDLTRENAEQQVERNKNSQIDEEKSSQNVFVIVPDVTIMNNEEPELAGAIESAEELMLVDAPAPITQEQTESPAIMKMDVPKVIVGREDSRISSNAEFILEDPNVDIVNPFTAPVELPIESLLAKIRSPVAAKGVKRRSQLKVAYPVRSRFYSPVVRRSLDRKAKIELKPTAARRTIFANSNKALPVKPAAKPVPARRTIFEAGTSKSTALMPGVSKTPTKIPQPSVKPKLLTCSILGGNAKFASSKIREDHQKTLKNASFAATFSCRWCDKKFQLDSALFNHQTENCLNIPVSEKRKLLLKRDKKEVDRRRTSIFKAPNQISMRKSPRRPADNNLNKSGIKITPKKSLKCHICSEIVPDAITMANHILSHKYALENPAT